MTDETSRPGEGEPEPEVIQVRSPIVETPDAPSDQPAEEAPAADQPKAGGDEEQVQPTGDQAPAGEVVPEGGNTPSDDPERRPNPTE